MFSRPAASLSAAVTRRSYQDSNIFGTKENGSATVQDCARDAYYKKAAKANANTSVGFMTKNVAPTVQIDLGPQINKFKHKQKAAKQYQSG